MALYAGPVITIDRIAAVVENRAIKQSDIDRDLRVTQFLNQARPDFTAQARKRALERLIEQELIRAEIIATTGSVPSPPANAEALLDNIVRDRFGGSRQTLEAELRRRGLTEAQLLRQLRWQLVVLRFLDQRFRPGVVIDQSDSDPAAREKLAAEAVDRNFEDWLNQARKAAVVEYKPGAPK